MLSRGYSPTIDDLRALPLEGRKLWSMRPTILLQTKYWSDGMAMPSSWWCHSLCATSCLHTRMPALSQPTWVHKKISAQLRRLYYWPGMRRDTDAWCRQCEGCAICRGLPSRPLGHHRNVSAGAPMDLVAIDILSGLPTTADGHKYLLVATNYFTQWLEAIPF